MKKFRHKSVLQKITTIHGTIPLTTKNGKSFTFWTLVMMGNLVFTIAFLVIIKQRYNNNQLLTKMDATCQVGSVPFPTVSICNFNYVSLKETRNVERVLKRYHISQKKIDKFFHDLSYLKYNSDFNDKLDEYTQIMAILRYHYFTVDIIMEEIHQKCENLLLYCSFNGKQKDCKNLFSLIKTYDGYCCAFNYAALNDANEDSLKPRDEDMSYYEDNEGHNSDQTSTVIATSKAGSSSGLHVIFNVEPKDYPHYSPVPYYGAKVLISDANDFPETTVQYKYVTLDEYLGISVDPMLFDSNPNIRLASPHERLCWFHDEVALKHTDRYSFETCLTECKMNSYMEFCGCIPYKYPRDKSARICEFKDLPCLHNMTVYRFQVPCKPICYMECHDKRYSITSDVSPFTVDITVPETVMKNQNISELSGLRVYYGRRYCNCYIFTFLIDFDSVIATYGGVFGLSFGVSIITLCEILYLLVSFVMKLLWRSLSFVMKRKKSN